jgi:hypothetical protein
VNENENNNTAGNYFSCNLVPTSCSSSESLWLVFIFASNYITPINIEVCGEGIVEINLKADKPS